ncbi:MAG: 23S rRNA (adenine(2503)-C(2))-methyltransferase [Gammaproteobacteria bacterium RBG_16_51_14]|nr:MAG: 23S rRNA (adenine(2503)-C(2))-methyltransferase [Gammaproteobacteria bacterium RBG_16_51_14]
MTVPVNLLELDKSSMEDFFIAMGEKSFRATQVLKWIYHRGITDFDQMTNLGKDLRLVLQAKARISMPVLADEQQSADGTRKWLVRLHDGNCIETVFIPEDDRGTLCISSQAGCPLDCSFCSTAKQGFNRNLTAGEIIGQVWLANQVLGHFEQRRRIITNIVFMGMGEPLLNYENVIRAIGLMTDHNGFGLARRRITISTSGIVPVMDRLAAETTVSLAVSLQATNNELRNELVPLNRRYPLEKLMAACRRYANSGTDASITMEYVMLNGVNDSPAEARQLVKLLHGIPAKINLIPFNPFPDTVYSRSSPENIEAFRTILMDAGFITITRKPRGDDIDAACGQLAGRVMPRTGRHAAMTTGYAA